MSEDPLRTYISDFLESPLQGRSSFGQGNYVLSTTVGRVRDENQDVALVVLARFAGQPDRNFDVAVLCDGMGGMVAGRDAAIMAASAFATKLIRTSRVPAQKRVFQALSTANHRVFQLFGGEGGCTLSAVLLVSDGKPVFGHVGDSRIYSEDNGSVRQVSTDDTLDAFRVNRNPESGRDTRLLQFIGIGHDLEPHVQSAGSNTSEYIITTDGAHDIPSGVFQRIIKGSKVRGDSIRNLILLSEMLGGLDNASAICTPARFADDYLGHPAGFSMRLLSPVGQLELIAPDLVESRQTLPANKAESAGRERLTMHANRSKKPSRGTSRPARRLLQTAQPDQSRKK